MEEEAVVAIWIGRCASRENFDKAMEVSFSEDGDFLGSVFSKAVGIEYFDSGLMEAGVLDSSRSKLEAVLAGVSYEGQILPQLDPKKSGPPWNCFVLLYSCRVDGSPAFSADGVKLDFLGNFTYDSAS